MQSKFIVLAVAALVSGPVLAQTNVTLYGVVDAGYFYSKGNLNSGTSGGGNAVFSGIQSGTLIPSHLGFRGTEALGNGLKAVFALEYQLEIATNTGIGNTATPLNARQQFVGLLSDNLGTVALGRQYAPGYAASRRNDPLANSPIGSKSILNASAGNTITPTSLARWNTSFTVTAQH